MKLKEMPQTERPREKLLKYGKENLSDSELLAIILKTGSKGENVCNLSLKILNQIKNLENLKNNKLRNLNKHKRSRTSKRNRTPSTNRTIKKNLLQTNYHKKRKIQ